MPTELPKQYEPAEIEKRVFARWLDAKAFAAFPDDNPCPYVIMMPLPNVTGALHMGHAMDNVMQDLLIRWHRMMGDNALWMPGTDHAGIATQAVVEKRLLELEGKTRHDVGRAGLEERIWQWKDQYQKRIVQQQQSMGCSCDWDRQRFTMDPVCAHAVRWTFFAMFRDGLIFRGHRLVNWDCQLQTAVADDEIVYETVQGYFYYLRYPVVDPQSGRADPRGRGHDAPGDHARRHRGGLSPRPGGRSRGPHRRDTPPPGSRRRRASTPTLAEELARLRSAPGQPPADTARPGPHGPGGPPGAACLCWAAPCRSSATSGPSPSSAAAA